MDNTEDMKGKINYTLEKYGETHVKELAKKIGHSPATVSRYLGILYAEGKLILTEKPPYKYYKLKEDK
jgi:Mn-dependent DtxR family transcriptional regulator